MTAAELLASRPHPTDAEIDASLAGHLCRCGTYQCVRKAVHRAAATAGSVPAQVKGGAS
jgi:isoquinoline 1-oxidoreductase alpha subunit